jgi:hypothetical protein
LAGLRHPYDPYGIGNAQRIDRIFRDLFHDFCGGSILLSGSCTAVADGHFCHRRRGIVRSMAAVEEVVKVEK